MAKVVAIMSMSLDGYVADANDGVADAMGWYFGSGDVAFGRRVRRGEAVGIPPGCVRHAPRRAPWERAVGCSDAAGLRRPRPARRSRRCRRWTLSPEGFRDARNPTVCETRRPGSR